MQDHLPPIVWSIVYNNLHICVSDKTELVRTGDSLACVNKSAAEGLRAVDRHDLIDNRILRNLHTIKRHQLSLAIVLREKDRVHALLQKWNPSVDLMEVFEVAARYGTADDLLMVFQKEQERTGCDASYLMISLGKCVLHGLLHCFTVEKIVELAPRVMNLAVLDAWLVMMVTPLHKSTSLCILPNLDYSTHLLDAINPWLAKTGHLDHVIAFFSRHRDSLTWHCTVMLEFIKTTLFNLRNA